MVEVVIPWRAGCPHRERAREWVLQNYREAHPGWVVTLAEAPAGPWAKARAAMPAIAGSSADVIVLADADVWTDGLAQAVDEVRRGAAWAIPHLLVHRLDQQATENVLAGDPWRQQATHERPYRGVPGGGFVVAPREVLLSVPMDPRFVGWGQEDESHAIALHTILGPAPRGDADLIHLWHPPQPRMTRRRGSRENWRLRMRYARARQDPAAMRRILEEARGALAADQPHVHADAA